MPYLSKIPLNPLRRGTQKLLQSPGAMHAAVLSGLPRQPVEERVLWRDERSQYSCSVLVLTQSAPSWEHVVEQGGWSTAEGAPLVCDLAPLLEQVVTGRQFGFRVRTNPVQSLARGTESAPLVHDGGARRSRGTRVAHRTAEHQFTWFVDRAARARDAWGFSVMEGGAATARLTSRERVSFMKSEGGRRVTLNRATFEGRLTVTDVNLFRTSLLTGLGSGKAYGCGLLTIAAVSDVVAG